MIFWHILFYRYIEFYQCCPRSKDHPLANTSDNIMFDLFHPNIYNDSLPPIIPQALCLPVHLHTSIHLPGISKLNVHDMCSNFYYKNSVKYSKSSRCPVVPRRSLLNRFLSVARTTIALRLIKSFKLDGWYLSKMTLGRSRSWCGSVDDGDDDDSVDDADDEQQYKRVGKSRLDDIKGLHSKKHVC